LTPNQPFIRNKTKDYSSQGSQVRHMKVLWRGKPLAGSRSGVAAWFREAFLPEGFPASVTDDYLRYQYFDTAQALCSSLVGTLATAGMLRAAGVGDAEATALGAVLTYMLGDGVGMVTRILFAWLKSSSLDAFSKQYRLLADVANDAALFVGIVSSKEHFMLALVAQSLLRAVVSVAGSATRAAVVVHQAHNGRGNVSDVAAKDGSQETLVNLVALVLGYLTIPIVVRNGWSKHLSFELRFLTSSRSVDRVCAADVRPHHCQLSGSVVAAILARQSVSVGLAN
jgi:hypothetical protein